MTTVAAPAYHVFPAPPPTVNNLSLRQKAQLRRSTTKLTKVLGATPQLVDEYAGPIRVSLPLPLSPAHRRQPSLTVTSGKKLHKRSKSANDRIDPELYPLSSALRKPPSSFGPSKRNTTISSPRLSTGSFGSRSVSVDLSSNKDTIIPATAPQPRAPHARPPKEDDAKSLTSNRDSLCDSLYEPVFTIPSESTLRRQKMARVYKLLGEGVPVDLVFPTDDDVADRVIDIRQMSDESADIPPPLPPKPSTSVELKQPKRLSYRASTNSTASAVPVLSTIKERSPRSSCSSSFSTESDSSVLTATTSSSYRFTSSASPSSSPSSSSSHDAFTSVFLAHPIREVSGTYGRREFAVYVPLNHRRSSSGSYAEIEKRGTQEFEVVRGMTDLNI